MLDAFYQYAHISCLYNSVSQSVSKGITNAVKTFREMQRCLKPGGLLVLVDGDKDFQDEHHRKIPMARIEGDEDVSGVSDEGSWFQRIMWDKHT